MSGKRVKKNKVEETAERVISIEQIEQIDELEKSDLLALLIQYGHNEKDMQGASKVMLVSLAKNEFALAQVKTKAKAKGKTEQKNRYETGLYKKLLNRKDTKAFDVAELIIDNPQISKKELIEKTGITPTATIVAGAEAMLSILYADGLLSDSYYDRINQIANK